MFTYRKKFNINSHEVIDFVRLLGRVGVKFQISDEMAFVEDEGDATRKTYFRRFYVYGTRRQFGELSEARDIMMQYHLH